MTGNIISFPPNDERMWKQIIDRCRANGMSEHAAEWIIADFRPRYKRLESLSFPFSLRAEITSDEIERAVRDLVGRLKDAFMIEMLQLEVELYSAR